MQRLPARLIRAVEPMAIEAAQLAERRKMERRKAEHPPAFLSSNSSRRAMRRLSPNAATPPMSDPDNRLIAATLEKNWETALRRVRDCEARLDPVDDERSDAGDTGIR